MAPRPARAAAVAAVIALAAIGCKPSSLTPFGIGTRGPETGGTGINGTWQGTTAAGGSVSFQIGDDKLTTLSIQEPAAGCNRLLESTEETPVTDGAFSVEIALDQGQAVVTATFTSETTCSGSYSFQGLATGGSCPTSGSVAFSANKLP